MAVTVDELVLKITLQNEKTASDIAKINDELQTLQKSAKKTSEGVDGFSAKLSKFSVIGFAAIKSIKTSISFLDKVTSSYFEARDAVTKLDQALLIAGTKSIPTSSKALQDLADQLEATGLASAEQFLGLAKIGIYAGNSTEQVEKLLKASADLASARDIPVEAAFRALSASLKGSAGSLAAFIPELKDMTEQQGKAGFAIEYVANLLGGAAAKNVDTFAGKMAVLGTKLGDIGEEIGKIITKIFGFEENISNATDYLENWRQIISAAGEVIVPFGQLLVEALKRIGSGLADVTIFLTGLFNAFKEGFGRILQGFGLLNTAIETVLGLSTGLGKSISDFGKDMAESANATRKAAFEVLNLDDVSKKLDQTQKNLGETTQDNSKKLAEQKRQLSVAQDAAKAWETLKSKAEEYGKAVQFAGLEGAAAIRAKADADSKELTTLYEKIKATGQLTTEQKKAYESASKAVSQKASADIAKLQLDSLDKIKTKNEEIALATAAIGATRRQQIDYELAAQEKALELEYKKLDVQDAASKAALDQQKKLLREQAQKKKDEGPSAAFEGLQKMGMDVAKQVSGVFTSGAMDIVGGAVTGVTAIIDAASAALDFLPNFLNSLAGLFNKLTEWPNMIVNALGGLFDAVINFVSNFIPNLLKMIPQIFSKIGAFITGLVDAFKGLLTSLPSIISDILDELPSIIENLISSFISAFPDIVASLLAFIVEKGPAIVWKLFKAVIFDIPKAIINGIIGGIAKIGKIIQNLFSGKGLPKSIKFDPKSIKDVGKKLSDNAKRVFSVEDLMKSAQDPVQKITGVIDKAFKKGRDYVMEAWKWVLDKVLKPIWELVTKAWRWVYDTVIAPIVGIIGDAWQFIIDFLKSLPELVSRAWQFVKDLLNGLGTIVSSSFQFVKDLWNSLATIVPNAFAFVKALWDLLAVYVKTAFLVVEALWDGLKNVVSVAFTFVKVIWDSLGQVVQSAFGFVKSLWDSLAGAVSIAFRFVSDIWNNLTGAVRIAFKFVTDLWDALVNVVKSAFESPKALFDSLKNVVQLAFKFVKDMFDNYADTVQKAFQFVKDLFDNFAGVVKNAFKFVQDIFDGLGNIVSGAFQYVKDLFNAYVNLGTRIWEGLKSGLESAGAIFSNLGSSIWEGLKSGLKGLGKLFTDAFDSLNPGNLFDKIFKVDMGGRGTVEKALGIDIPFMSFATGGTVPGQASVPGDSSINDRILALLSPGEAIIPRSAMNDPAIAALVKQIIDGDLVVPQYKLGGTLGTIIDKGSDVVNTVVETVSDAVEAAGDVFSGPLKDLWNGVKDKVFNEMLYKMFQKNRFATGGLVDSVPALLTPGEFVMSRPAVESIGLDNLRAMNSGRQMTGNGGDTYMVNLEINIDAKMAMDEGYIRATLIPRMSEELKRASLDGKFVLSAKGIR